MGNAESFDPFSGIVYERKTLAGSWKIVNKYIVADLVRLGLWSPEMKNRIIAAGDNVQGIREIPKAVRETYKTVWEIKQRALIKMHADKGAYVCQSASNNLYIHQPDVDRINNMAVYAWTKKLKTGVYYLRVAPKMQAHQFTVDPLLPEREKKMLKEEGGLACNLENPGSCDMCGA